MWWTILPALLLYSQASFCAIERGPHLMQYDNDQLIATLMNLLTRTNKDTQQFDFDHEYSDPGSNNMYDINIKNTQNIAVQRTTAKLVTAQKNGQNEFVGFIEPKVSNQRKHKEILTKRVEDHQVVQQTYLKPTLHLAMVTVCMLAVVVGIATGSYYFLNIRDRSRKSPVDGCHFAYAPTGPGKSAKKKGGDEGLAYKAQLHHYQQAKQQIISDEASDDENNFSVYECPGLAPTGDIEVQNPNFISRT